MKDLNDRIENACEDAQANFWETIKDRFPEIMTGDTDVKASNDFNVACDIIVRHWYKNNLVGHHTPTATYHALKQLQTEFPEMGWEDVSYGNDASDSLECIVNGAVKVRVWVPNPDDNDMKDFVVCESKDGDEFKDAHDVSLTDLKQVVELIRLTYTKQPRKPILWSVFDVNDRKGIKEATGYEFGNELPDYQENFTAVLISSGNKMWVILRNDGKFFTIAGNEDALGTLEECVKCMDGFETVE